MKTKNKPRKKIAILAIDAMDSKLLSLFLNEMPNLKKLINQSPKIKSKSVFPPDTPTAWATIYTGLNPAKHGILSFVDPLDKVSQMATGEINNSFLKGKTFWDIASKNGKKVCIITPQLGYPVWTVNGAMIGRSTELYRNIPPVQSFPDNLLKNFKLNELAAIKAVPKKTLIPKYIEEYKNLVLKEINISKKFLSKDQWDLFFVYSSALDWIGHNLWSYFDKNDPSYPGSTKFESILRDFYILYDQFIGEIQNNIDDDTVFLLMSDHGFCRRPYNIFNINLELKRLNLLKTKLKRKNASDPYYILEWIKKQGISFVNKYGAGRTMLKLVHTIPSLRKIYTVPPSINWSQTSAYVSDLSGIKPYFYGGIIINQKLVKLDEYIKISDLLIKHFSKMKKPGTEKLLFKWIKKREDLYSGMYIEKYPDILFELDEDYGTGWSITESLFSKSKIHNIQSGSHSIHTPVFLVSNVNHHQLIKNSINLEDICPSILYILNIKNKLKFDGESIFL